MFLSTLLTLENKSGNREGISIIELLLVVAFIVLIGASGAPVYSNFLSRSYLKNKTNEIVSSLQTAKINALSGKEDSRWGVRLDASKITLFKGNSFASRDSAFDIVYSVPVSISFSGNNEVVFIGSNATPSATVSITISNNLGESNTVTVNQVGAVNLN